MTRCYERSPRMLSLDDRIRRVRDIQTAATARADWPTADRALAIRRVIQQRLAIETMRPHMQRAGP